MEVTTLLQLIAAFVGGSAATWLIMRDRRLAERIAELERQKATPAAPGVWAEGLRLDHRAQLLSVAQLVKLSARDQLDALMRLSPELVRELLREEFPWLFDKETK